MRRYRVQRPFFLWWVLGSVFLMMLGTVVVPAWFVELRNTPASHLPAPAAPPPPITARQEDKVTMALEQYVYGVVAAEMPALFEPEALKAQAIIARTYALYQWQRTDKTVAVMAKVASPENTAYQRDSLHLPAAVAISWQQAYATDAQLRQKWGESRYATYAQHIRRAVEATRGIILTHQGQPIEATFFSTSNGYTEDAKNVWQNDVTYLRRVSSPWDAAISPHFEHRTTMPIAVFCARLQLTCNKKVSFARVHRFESGRLAEVYIQNVRFTGTTLRQRLQLKSTDIRWIVQAHNITLITKGYGHGVGMSQWGAQGLAQRGHNAAYILQHYYPSTTLTRYAD